MRIILSVVLFVALVPLKTAGRSYLDDTAITMIDTNELKGSIKRVETFTYPASLKGKDSVMPARNWHYYRCTEYDSSGKMTLDSLRVDKGEYSNKEVAVFNRWGKKTTYYHHRHSTPVSTVKNLAFSYDSLGRLNEIVSYASMKGKVECRDVITRYDDRGNWLERSEIDENGKAEIFRRRVGYASQDSSVNEIVVWKVVGSRKKTGKTHDDTIRLFSLQKTPETDGEGYSVNECEYDEEDGLDNKVISRFNRQGLFVSKREYDEDGDLNKRDTVIYDGYKNRIKEINYKSDGKIERVFGMRYDAAGRLAADSSFDEDGVLDDINRYGYSVKGHLAFKTDLDPRERESLDRKFLYYNYDTVGNWTARAWVKSDDLPMAVYFTIGPKVTAYYRRIEYYKRTQ